MILVSVVRDPGKISDEWLEVFARVLPTIIAERLSELRCSRSVNVEEVEVRFSDVGPFDVNKFPLGITIHAKHCDFQNQLIINGRAKIIANDLCESIPGELKNFYVWVLDVDGGLFETKPV